MNVYFRDTNKILQYFMRIWLYLSPILWQPEMFHGWHRAVIYLNPLGPTLSATSHIWINGQAPTLAEILGMFGWAFASIVFGGYFFISRERDFAVRI